MHELFADDSPAEGTVLRGWGALWLAIALNVSQVFLLDSSEGLDEPALLPVAVVGFLGELVLFAWALRCLSSLIAYTAYGTTPAIVTVLSVTFFGEALTFPKFAGVVAITAGVVLLATDRTAAPRASCAQTIARPPATPPEPDNKTPVAIAPSGKDMS
jgi:multidrug transporter EmrE-like cation transporter